MKHPFTVTLQASDGRAVFWKGQAFLNEVSHGAQVGEPDGHTVEAIIDIESDIRGQTQEIRMSGATWRVVEGMGAGNDLIQLAILDADEANATIDLIERSSDHHVYRCPATATSTVACMAYANGDQRNSFDTGALQQSGLWQCEYDHGVTGDSVELETGGVTKIDIGDMISEKLQIARQVYEADILKDRLNFIAAQLQPGTPAHHAATAHLPKPVPKAAP